MSREGDRKRLISEVYRLVTGEFADTATINDIGAMITFAKNMMLSDEEIEALSGSGYDTLRIYREYNLALSSRSLMDYDDQMVTALDILRKYPDILAYFHGRFRYICVDEAQDTSKIQHEIIRLLAVKAVIYLWWAMRIRASTLSGERTLRRLPTSKRRIKTHRYCSWSRISALLRKLSGWRIHS